MRILIILLLALLVFGCRGDDGDRSGQTDPIEVKVAKLSEGRLANVIAADGKVKSRRTASVSSTVTGRVVMIQAKVGDKVGQGEALIIVEDPKGPSEIRRLTAAVAGAQAQLDSARITTDQSSQQKSSDVQQATSDVKVAAIAVTKAESSLKSAQTELTRKQDLLVKKAIAETDVEQARLSRDQAQADLHTAQVQLQASKDKLATARESLSVSIQKTQVDEALASLGQAQADLESALAQQQQDVIRSPISGVVAERNVELGQNPATSSEPLMTITDDSELRVEALFDERYSKQLRPGLRAVGVSVADSDVEIPLMIERVTPESKEALVAVELAPIQGAGMKLTTDSYMRVRLMLDNPEGVLIPISAVTWDDKGETSVMIAEGRFARTRKITIQDQNESKVLVTSGEVKAGELLIVEGQTGLPDGAEVTYKE